MVSGLGYDFSLSRGKLYYNYCLSLEGSIASSGLVLRDLDGLLVVNPLFDKLVLCEREMRRWLVVGGYFKQTLESGCSLVVALGNAVDFLPGSVLLPLSGAG